MRCKSCNKSFTPKYQESFCENPACREAVLEAAYKKKTEKAQAKSAKQKLAPKKNEVSKERLLEVQINTLIRTIDYGQRCISCNDLKPLHAGHFHSVGANPYLRFHLLNIWGQCFECNGEKGGKPIQMAEGILQLCGNDSRTKSEISLLKSKAKPLKLTDEQFQEAISNLRLINKHIEKERVLSPKERIDLRKELNQEIGIYDY